MKPEPPDSGRAELLGPVAIGGVGGSGTRVVAQILSDIGFYLGGDLNRALDNRWFTVLFKRPGWYRRSRVSGDTRFNRTAGAFVDVMQRGRHGALAHFPLIIGAAADMSRSGHDSSGFGAGTWPFRRVATMLAARPPTRPDFAGWGWKEPNTHLFLPELAAAIPGLRYIHVVRHGLDMAFSGNQNQLYNFGWLVNGAQGDDRAPLVTPATSLDFWIAANERALTLGNTLLGERFMVINMDTLWRDAANRISELVAFVGQHAESSLIEQLAELPTRPASTGRYRDQDLGGFSSAQLEAVEALGFEVDARIQPSYLRGDAGSTIVPKGMEPFFFDRASLAALAETHRTSFARADPFPHVVIDDFLPPQVLLPVLEEFPEVPAEGWRQRDEPNERKLSLNDEARMGPATRQLIQQFNSQVFMQFLEVLTGIPGLIPDPYLVGGGLHKIVAGGLLKIHADFNRHRDLHLDRRLNLLVYLNQDWDESYGGCLELWDPTMTTSRRRILPVFNRCVVFATGETSYHGHPDPLTCPPERARRSMALYYYSSNDVGGDDEHTTLFQARPGEVLSGPSVLRRAVRSIQHRRSRPR